MKQGTESLDAQITHHIKGDVIWALGPKAKHAIMKGQWCKELKDISSQELLKLFKKTFLLTRNVFHSRTQFFNIKEEDNETLDEYWKQHVDIERKCKFSRITPEVIITYKFAATMNDTTARDTFIKGPLKLQLVPETIELDNYNRKYGDKKFKNRKQRKTSSGRSSEIQPGREKRTKRTRRNKISENVHSAESLTVRRNFHARHGRHSGTIVKGREILPRYADQAP